MNYDPDYRAKMPQSTYEIVETIEPVAAAAMHITSTYIEQLALVAIVLHFASGACIDGQEEAKPGSSTSKRSTRAGRRSQERVSSTEGLAGEQLARYLLEGLRPLVRKTDRVFLVGSTLYFLLPGADLQGGQIVQNRLWEALLWRMNNLTDADPLVRCPCTFTIGYSAYPVPCIDIDGFIEAASDVALRFDWQPSRPTRRRVASREGVRDRSRAVQQGSSSEQEATSEDLPGLARKLGVPYLSLLPRKLPEQVQQLVNPKLAQELHCYPLGRERNMLTVAMLNPRDHSTLDRLHQETGLHIFPVLTHPHVLETALQQLIC